MSLTVQASPVKGMRVVPGGIFCMGSEDFYPEEQPVCAAEVGDLLVDEHPVTNAEFRRFVKDTGHRTVAERAPDPGDFPSADPSLLVAGSQVFTPTPGPVPLDDWTRWWRWEPGADWRHPEGPGSTLDGHQHHPVVHIGYEDALAYAVWADKVLPTEAEWEHAARGGLEGATYAWGDQFAPAGRTMANTWHGRFPWENLTGSGRAGTSPVDRYRPNGYGLRDVTGNVWEWTTDSWTGSHRETSSCCGPSGADLGEQERRTIKGGSHLCAPSYCHRHRPAARQGHTIRSTTGHLGFRCVRRLRATVTETPPRRLGGGPSRGPSAPPPDDSAHRAWSRSSAHGS